MKYIGFSTGALAYSDFIKALEVLKGSNANAIELSALRRHELEPLAAAVNNLDLSQFDYISVHAPGTFDLADELQVIKLLEVFAKNNWPIIIHPDTIKSIEQWRTFGRLLLIENMDSRKPTGRSCVELERLFDQLPESRFCFDIAHARQYDSTMNEAKNMINKFKSLITQLHISDVDNNSIHRRLSSAAINDFQKVSKLIPQDVPVIIETFINKSDLDEEMCLAIKALVENGVKSKPFSHLSCPLQ